MRVRNPMQPVDALRRGIGAVGGVLALAGCNPNLDIDGALVPAWITAGVFGVAATVGARALLVRTGVDRHLVARPAVYLSLAVVFTCSVWIVVFRH